MIVVSGIQPSGKLHVGNALGAVRQWLALQGEQSNRCFFFIADWHSLTEEYDPAEKAAQVRELAAEVLRRSEGPFRDSRYYNWQTEAELRALYRSLGLVWIAMHPIDRLAWLGGISPAQLTDEQRGEWLRVELALPSEAAGMCARYMLVVAAKPGAIG